jgi:hypothetical protein
MQSSREGRRRRIPLSVKLGGLTVAALLVAGASPKNTFPHEKGGDVPVLGSVLDGIYDGSGDLPVAGKPIRFSRWLYEHNGEVMEAVDKVERFGEGVNDRVDDAQDRVGDAREGVNDTVDRLPDEVPDAGSVEDQIQGEVEEYIPDIG